jgi:hypothetical protein
MLKWTLLALPCALAACNATTDKPPRTEASSVGSPRSDFSKYQTFTFGPANPPATGYDTTARSLEVQRRVTPLVQAQLQKRGYAERADHADLVIKLSTGTGSEPGEKTQHGSPAAPTATGFIGIDAYDSQTGAGVWHGLAFAEIDPEQINDALLARGVQHMLADFPARPDAAPDAHQASAQ